MKRSKTGPLLLMGGVLLTAFLVWFAVNSQQRARPVAQALLRGLVLSHMQAIENLASRDPSFRVLSDYAYRDIAYFALIDSVGRVRFHQNPELIGETVTDDLYRQVFSAAAPVETRLSLGTGEEVYQCDMPLHLPGETLALRLVLHTWQADQIINGARTGAMLLMAVTAGGWILGFLLFRLSKREARQQEQMARQEQMAKLGEMGAVLAHEVRTPLAGIKGYAQLLKERTTDDRSRRFSGLIEQETVRLEGLVNDLLDYVRQDNPGDGCTPLNEALLNDVWNMVAKTRAVSPEFSLPPGLMVTCRPERLRQLLLNLFGNALQAIEGQGVVTVTGAQEQGMVVLKVKDSGAGFTEEALQRAFDPFYTTRPRGSGLGLAVCRKIAEGCGGGISAANQDWGGAVITVRLPLCSGRDD